MHKYSRLIDRTVCVRLWLNRLFEEQRLEYDPAEKQTKSLGFAALCHMIY